MICGGWSTHWILLLRATKIYDDCGARNGNTACMGAIQLDAGSTVLTVATPNINAAAVAQCLKVLIMPT